MNSKLMKMIQGLNKLTFQFPTGRQEPGAQGETWCDRQVVWAPVPDGTRQQTWLHRKKSYLDQVVKARV